MANGVDNPLSGSSKGILNPQIGGQKFQLVRPLPSADLSYFVEQYWIITWDLRGQEPFVQETLPFPSIHLVFEKNNSRVYGIERGKFARRLENVGRVFGIKFRPGAFYPFLKAPVSKLTNHSFPLSEVLKVDSRDWEDKILSLEDSTEMLVIAENFLHERLPERDEVIAVINQIVDRIIAEREITKVEDVAAQFNFSKRTLQRLFSQYVGVSPKWVIQRYRLQEAAEQLATGGQTDWAKLAVDLGYFDQAHFIKDFKTLIGQSPAEYAKGFHAHFG
jgi:AraC-like DNA-binding protein